MSNKKVMTTSELIVLAGFDKSPAEIIAEDVCQKNKAHNNLSSLTTRLKRWLMACHCSFKNISTTDHASYESISEEVVIRRYRDGLNLIENRLIGPGSDWNKALIDLHDRHAKAAQNLGRFDERISEAKRVEDDVRYLALKGGKARCISYERGLREAIESVSSLLQHTRTEIDKLYGCIHPVETGVYTIMRRRLYTLIDIVNGCKLRTDSAIEAIDMPRYLEEVEKATEAIVKISDS